MASAFASLDLSCDECGDRQSEKPKQGYKVVEQRHLCKACARRIADAILSDVTAAASKWPCLQHKTKEVELYCTQCTEAICHMCALTTHSGHKLEEITKIVAHSKGKVQEQIKDISAKQSEAKHYLEMITKCNECVEKHFDTLQDKLTSILKQKYEDIEETRRSEVEKANRDAEEEIKKITENRDALIADIYKRTKMIKDKLENNRKATSTELEDTKSTLCHKTSELRVSAEKIVKTLNAAHSAAKTIFTTSDNKPILENVTMLHKSTKEALTFNFDMDIAEVVTSIARKVRFTRDGDGQKIGNVVGKKRSYELTKTIKVPSYISEPYLIGSFGENTVVIRDGTGTAAHTVNVDTGVVEVLIHPDKELGIWDIAFIDDKSIAYSDYKAGVIRVCNMKGKPRHSIRSPKDASRYAYLTVDSSGKILAADHAEGSIYVIDPIYGTQLWNIPNTGGKAILSLGTMECGDIVVRSGPSEITVLDQSGVTKSTISVEEWSRRINCHVGADDMIYVIYRNNPKDDSTGRVSMISADGTTRRENVIEFPTSWLYRYIPRCAVPTAGTIIILNGSVILVYKETPGIDDLMDTNK